MEFYRYYEYVTGVGWNGYQISYMLETWYLVKETPCGYWISPYTENYHGYDFAMQENKWVSKTARKRYAYPTKEEAWNGYKHRKRRHLKLLKAQVDKVHAVWEQIKELDTAPENPVYHTPSRQFFAALEGRKKHESS